MVKKQDNITLNMDLGEMTGKGSTFARVNRSGVNRKKDLFEEVYLEENKTLPKKDAVYNASAEVDNIPQFGDFTLKIPPFFAVPSKTGWRLANPLTAMRNLANRQKELSVNIKRANVPEPELVQEEPEETPTFDDFSAKDQAKLVAYFEAVKQGKEEEYLFKNKPRGFPAVLYKNAKKAGLKQTKEKVYTKNVIKKQPKIPKAKKGPKRMEVELQEDVEPEPEAPNRVEQVKKQFDDFEKKLKEKSAVELDKGLIKDYTDFMFEVRKEIMIKDSPLNIKPIGKRFNDLNRLYKSIKSEREKEREKEKEKENTEIMGAEDIAGQKLREAEKEEKAKAKAAVERFKAKAKAKKLEEEKARDLEEARKILERSRAAKAKTTGGELPKGLNPLEIIPKGLKAVKDKVVDIAQKVIKGRDGYSPSVTAIIEKFADQEVKSIELHRRVLPTVYTGLLNVLTLGEFNKRIKDQPKDKLFHISMWVKLANGKTVLVEKNEVINMKVNPKKEKEEEVQPAGAVPAGLKFGEMLDKTQKEMGSKYFTYSARDNNCGNYIEAVLKANGMNTEATHAFIGQDAKAILKGYPRIAKLLNVITDTAGRANVLMEGGGMGESDCGCGSESECECDDKEMNGEGASASVSRPVIPPEDLEAYNKLSKKHKKFYNDTSNEEIRSHWLRITPNDRRRLLKYVRTNMPEDLNKVYDDMTDSEEETEMSGRGFHVATMTNRFHRIPQSEAQMKSHLQGSGIKGAGSIFGRLRVEPEETPELPPYETEQERIEREALQIRQLAAAEARRVAEAEARQVAEENRRAAKEARRKAREDRRIAAEREEYIHNFKNNLLTKTDIDKLTEMGRRSATTREDQIRFVFKITKPKIMKDKTLSEMEKDILMRYVFDVVDNLTDEEIIIREVPNAVSIPYYSINDIREASVVPSKISKAVPIKNITKPTETLPVSTATLIPNTPHSFLPPDTPYISGFGLKKPKFAKGSQEAKDYMKMLRDKRGKK